MSTGTIGPTESSHDRERRRFRMLLILFSIETLLINVARLPESMSFDRYAFCDHGANLTLQYLIAGGLRPALDFGYAYGLLPALVGRIWFGIFGASPWAYQGAMIIADLLCAWAIAKILARLEIGAVGLTFAVITLAYAFQATYVNFAHALDAVLLSHALAEQARGSRPNALALTTAAVFAKPALGYVYGLVLIALIVHDLTRERFSIRRTVTAIAPAGFVFVSLSALLAAIYGPRTLMHTVLPGEGAANYRAMHFGLLGTGRGLWDPTGKPWIFYLIDVSGLWILSGLYLLFSAGYLLVSANTTLLTNRRGELIVTCAVLHLAFLGFLFGNQWSWIYYSYVLMIGMVVATECSSIQRRIALALCALAVVSFTDLAYWTHRWWLTTTPETAADGLWISRGERDEWLRVIAIAREHRTVMLQTTGAAQLMFPDLGKPVSFYLTAGLMLPEEIQRKSEELARAEVVVVPITISACSGIPPAPEFDSALKNFDLAWKGEHFQVFQSRALGLRDAVRNNVAGLL